MNETQSQGLIIRRYEEGDERGIVEVLNGSRDLAWCSIEDWTWRHKSHPNFDPECIYVAEEGAKIVGCWHAAAQDFKIGKSFLRMSFEGDTAILPGHRGLNAVIGLYNTLNKSLVKKGVVLKVGFANEHVSGFYMRLFGYFNMPFVMYMKVISPKFFKDRALEINSKLKMNELMHKELEKFNLVIQFHLKDIPSFLFVIKDGEIFVEEGERDTPDMVISGDQGPVLAALKRKNRRNAKIELLKAVLTGRVRIKGWFRNTLKLYKFFRTLLRLRGIQN